MITLKNREGTRVDLDITRDDASQIAPALARGWAFVEVVEQEITHEAPDAPPAPKVRKARAPKAETAPKEKTERAPKEVPSDNAAAVYRQIPEDGTKINGNAITGDLGRGMLMVDRDIKRALAYLVDTGRIVRDKRGRGGTWYGRATEAQS